MSAVREAWQIECQYRELLRKFSSPYLLYAMRQRGTTGPIKLGRSTNPKKRMRVLQEGVMPLELLATVPEWIVTEDEAHAMWAHLRVHGEWFQATTELLEWLGQMNALIEAPRSLVQYKRIVMSIMRLKHAQPLRHLVEVERCLARAIAYEARAQRIRARF